ncbi:hypothetical protein [Gorillibacterium massiliense]|uniref:hypothetical protein n=1 Tax=Gorillibacterium massiliense TaxID=1280390 RepID=UPI0004B31FE6|nr:hypothetical protein [Gorillibacterium massiliense]
MVKRRIRHLLLICAGVLVLGGCMVRPETNSQSGIQPGDYVPVVQQAVDVYLEREHKLPVKVTDAATPLYEKYPVDLLLLKDSGDLAKIPADAFENGGHLQYVLYYLNGKPAVRLLDLRAFQAVKQAQDDVDAYKSRHGGQLPFGEMLSSGFYLLDFHKLGVKEPRLMSPYSGDKCYLIVNETGTVGVDYAADIGQMMADHPDQSPHDDKTDLRRLLTDEGFFLPVRSFPYYWIDDLVTLQDN